MCIAGRKVVIARTSKYYACIVRNEGIIPTVPEAKRHTLCLDIVVPAAPKSFTRTVNYKYVITLITKERGFFVQVRLLV